MKIIDLRSESKGIVEHRDLKSIEVIMLHRIWFDDIDLSAYLRPSDIIQRFEEDPEMFKYTGGKTPYTFLVDKKGVIYQCLEIRDIAPHARRWNVPAISIGIIGDLRKRSPTNQQYSNLVGFCALLCPFLDIDPLSEVDLEASVRLGPGQYGRGYKKAPALGGHTEYPGSSSDPNKECPGANLNLQQFRVDVYSEISNRAGVVLHSNGLKISV